MGAGKSTILDYLNRRYHARIIEADKVGHFLMEPGQKVYYHIVETFGSGIFKKGIRALTVRNWENSFLTIRKSL
ncbi:MAG: dephospho-CoA kinase [Lachnospiraceae bacterium]